MCLKTMLSSRHGAVADKAALRVQAVKDDARLRALAHVGISGSAIAPDGKPWGNRITSLKENWGKAWWEVLDHQQKGVRKLSSFRQRTMVNGSGTMVYTVCHSRTKHYAL